MSAHSCPVTSMAMVWWRNVATLNSFVKLVTPAFSFAFNIKQGQGGSKIWRLIVASLDWCCFNLFPVHKCYLFNKGENDSLFISTAEKFSMGHIEAWCLPIIRLLCTSLVGLKWCGYRNYGCRWTHCTKWGGKHFFLKRKFPFETLAPIFMILHCLIAEAPRKHIRRVFSYSSQYHGSEG